MFEEGSMNVPKKHLSKKEQDELKRKVRVIYSFPFHILHQIFNFLARRTSCC